MPNEMEARSLTTCDVAPDGNAVHLRFEDTKGQPGALTLPTACIQQLVMTLPHLLSKAIRTQTGDESLRAVFPLGAWHIEAQAGTPNFILTMMTPDGFEVAFSLKPPAMGKMMSTIEEARSAVERLRKTMNS